MKTKLQIKGIKVERKLDESPDTSHLGKFSDTFAGCETVIIRYGEHKGKLASEVPADELPAKSREHRFFIASMSGEETGNPESPMQDWKRMESLNAGVWNYIGVIAKAEIWNPVSQVTQVIRSGGLWGIESDSDGEYLALVEKEELAQLKTELLALGIGGRAIQRAFSKLG